ncbi:MAG: heme-binding domain-containing protein [Chitinophagaceae bacterium]
MKKLARKIVIIGFVIFLLMQLYQPARNKDNGQVLSSHITKMHPLPDSVNVIFESSCYDCHSNNTKYPWYSYIQPARFIMERHIRNGKKDLNFSEFGNYSRRQQESKLKSISKQVKSGDMPLASYIFLHKNAKLTSRQKEAVIRWVDTTLKNYE